ncbi:MAG TPA: hypothetical protein VHV83_18380 [Armatimonadota bacterium]|nr:hypothetical protein [Armatimonadota bacterium]
MRDNILNADYWICAGIWLTYPNRDSFPGDHGHRDVTISGNTIVCTADGPRRAMLIGSESKNVLVADNTISGGKIWKGGTHKSKTPLTEELVEVQQGTVINE